MNRLSERDIKRFLDRDKIFLERDKKDSYEEIKNRLRDV